ncbi:hypothetical protein [Blattabacterium cuenoti]|uniref:Uncharacterized protein n=1 Tax=Blattabacterium cuenoti STAT TaxID=1457030 RepID=A0A224AJ78_9FLAO|nr:hypothetical protein [Blattabacterium cuenoti]BBA17453.1 hypothetical protein STAT_547 [Blattabacterium cuenoti STAT]
MNKNFIIKKNREGKKEDVPKKIFFKTNLFYKEKGFLKFFIYSPIVKEYAFYTLFPNGLNLFIYDKNTYNKYTYLRADWVKSIDKMFFHIKGNIIIMSHKGVSLKTEEIFWDRRKKKIFNKKYTKIIFHSKKMILYAINGIEASEDLKKIRLKNINGTFPVK